ncbi:PREDICTED: uncharacterized protein LOC104704585 [Camelina sativa]|uniref:Uncharacterized protein LOC104704585 n=1 Tax=Camelina sativa TaxID=90675 RepID=A0ABM0T0J3_CAMSA|nr:PREDICTED: uncharacterized protein LOC104704585 [Camelina sativa]
MVICQILNPNTCDINVRVFYGRVYFGFGSGWFFYPSQHPYLQSNKNHFFLVISTLIILDTISSATSISPNAPTMIQIEHICLNTVNMHYCEQSFISKLENPHAEIATLAKIAAFNALYTTTPIYGFPKAENPLAETQLRTCLATYNDVEKFMEVAYKAMLQNEYSEMRRYQSTVLGVFDNGKSDFDLMVRTNWWVRLMINISIFASPKFPAP